MLLRSASARLYSGMTCGRFFATDIVTAVARSAVREVEGWVEIFMVGDYERNVSWDHGNLSIRNR